LARAQEGVGILLKDVKSLRERNDMLTAELQDIRDAAGSLTMNRLSDEGLQKEVLKLKSVVQKLDRVGVKHYI
jgi:hypothetical protein